MQTVVEAIDKLTDATAYSWGSYSLAMGLNLLPVLAGAGAAYFFTHKHWGQVSSRDAVAKKALALCVLIDEIEEISLPYWVAGSAVDESRTQTIAEIKIKSKVPLSVKLISEFLEEPALSADGPAITSLALFSDVIYELVTGGDFEGRGRLENPRKAMRIAKLCSKTKASIFRYCQ